MKKFTPTKHTFRNLPLHLVNFFISTLSVLAEHAFSKEQAKKFNSCNFIISKLLFLYVYVIFAYATFCILLQDLETSS